MAKTSKSQKTPHVPVTKRPIKAYRNLDFLTRPENRHIRVMCELLEPAQRLERHQINHTLVMFGSARILPEDVAYANLAAVKRKRARTKEKVEALKEELRLANLAVEMSQYYEEARELAYQLAVWSMRIPDPENRFYICSGGGPGIMEAANRGAEEAGMPSIGLNISLPFEQHPNPYIEPDLSFEFHYFFIRKFWLVYPAKALITFPGGFGTLDEFFEVLTLVQTKKIKRAIPIILYGKQYWKKILNLDAMYEYGAISKEDLQLFRIVDNVEEAFNVLTQILREQHPENFSYEELRS
jgi:uncharacterized protein (TIGR00730 family)